MDQDRYAPFDRSPLIGAFGVAGVVVVVLATAYAWRHLHVLSMAIFSTTVVAAFWVLGLVALRRNPFVFLAAGGHPSRECLHRDRPGCTSRQAAPRGVACLPGDHRAPSAGQR